jgi:transcriptional antiterminator NusG
MSDEEQQELESGAEGVAANVPPVEGEPSENPEALETRLGSAEEHPADDELSPVDPGTAVGAQGEADDPEAQELEAESEHIDRADVEDAVPVVDDAEDEALAELDDERAETMAEAPDLLSDDGESGDSADVEPADEDEEEAAQPQEAEATAEDDVSAEVEEEAEPTDEDEGEIAESPAEAEVEESRLEMGDDEDELEPVEAVPDDDRLWYVIHCYSGQENKVRHNLEQRIDSMGMKDRIFDVVVPTEEEIEVKDGKRRTVERRVFPGYILVQMILSEDSWYVVRNTPGVTGFVGMGNEPTPLRPEEVSQIIKRMEAEAPRIKVTYKIGQKVRIIDGPFNDFIGTVDDIDMERAKVRVMVSFFGRETPVELDFLQVEKA